MKVWGIFLLLFGASAASASENWVYLIGKYQLTGAAYTQVVFFYDKEVPDLGTCEQERIRGHNGKWRYYRHVVYRTIRLPFTVNYFCTQTPIEFDTWSDHNLYDYVYLVDLREETFNVTPAKTIAECLTQLHKSQPEESHTFFCGTSNQRVVKR